MGRYRTKVTVEDQQEVPYALSIGAKINDLERYLCTLFQNACAMVFLLIYKFHIQSAFRQLMTAADVQPHVRLGRYYSGLDLSEPEANNNRRVIGRRKKHAASRGFLATTRLLLLYMI